MKIAVTYENGNVFQPFSKSNSNEKLNKIASHEPLVVNEKRKSQYVIIPNAVMFVGTNNPVEMTDTKSGLKRRLVDIQPSGNKLPQKQYEKCIKAIYNF